MFFVNDNLFTAFVDSVGGAILVQGARAIQIKTGCNVRDFIAKITISRKKTALFHCGICYRFYWTEEVYIYIYIYICREILRY